MTPDKSLSKIFGKFAGKEIKNPRPAALNTDPVLLEMQKVAKDNGLNLRVWLPNGAGTCDYRTDRVNAFVEKEADGKYRVQNNFARG